jgi:hypothetical protein
MRLLEIVPCSGTDPEVVAFMSDFIARRLGKGIVFAKDTPNFIANRIGVYSIASAIRHMVDMDMNVEEVALAALLHDLTEILLWCFAPKLAIEIRDMQQADITLRSAVAQERALWITLFDLQLALCHAWHLPELLATLMDDAHTEQPRVRNVTLAVNLARHSAKGWTDAALPDDFNEIQRLLRIDRETLMTRLNLPPEIVALYVEPKPEEDGDEITTPPPSTAKPE